MENIMESKEIHLGEIEARFANIIWDSVPTSTGSLYRICKEEFGWTMSTTATVLRRLCQKGLFRVENRIVYTVLSRKDFYAAQSEQFVRNNFGGSFSGFFAAFTNQRKLTPEEIADMRAMIDAYEKNQLNNSND